MGRVWGKADPRWAHEDSGRHVPGFGLSGSNDLLPSPPHCPLPFRVGFSTSGLAIERIPSSRQSRSCMGRRPEDHSAGAPHPLRLGELPANPLGPGRCWLGLQVYPRSPLSTVVSASCWSVGCWFGLAHSPDQREPQGHLQSSVMQRSKSWTNTATNRQRLRFGLSSEPNPASPAPTGPRVARAGDSCHRPAVLSSWGDCPAGQEDQGDPSFLSKPLQTSMLPLEILKDVSVSGKSRLGADGRKTHSHVHCLAATAHPGCEFLKILFNCLSNNFHGASEL